MRFGLDWIVRENMKSPKDGGGWFGCLVRLGGMFISPMFSWYFCNIQW